MGDDEASGDDPWFERLTDADEDDPDPSETSADGADESVPSTDQWEWVRADDPQSGRDVEPTDGERIWDQLEDAETDTNAGKTAVGPEQDIDGDDETTAETGRAEGTKADTDGTAGRQDPSTDASPVPTSSDTPASESDELPPPEGDGSGGVDVPPPPPTARKQPDSPPGPIRRDIREMQPLYKRRRTEFYLLWLAAALSYGLGDMVTTSVVFVIPRFGESNPVVALVMDQFGLAGFLATKLVIFGLLLAISVKGAVDDDRLSYYGPPLLAIVIGTALTVWNLKIILGL